MSCYPKGGSYCTSCIVGQLDSFSSAVDIHGIHRASHLLLNQGNWGKTLTQISLSQHGPNQIRGTVFFAPQDCMSLRRPGEDRARAILLHHRPETPEGNRQFPVLCCLLRLLESIPPRCLLSLESAPKGFGVDISTVPSSETGLSKYRVSFKHKGWRVSITS